MNKIDLLDHGFIRLVDNMGDDLSIVRNARVSYNAAWRAGEDKGSDAALIRYLLKNHHNTPFEAVTFTFEVKAPIFVARQWMRHRTQSYNELSARYKELPKEFYVPKAWHVGVQNKDNKQMRDIMTKEEYFKLPGAEQELIRNFVNMLREQNEVAFFSYEIALSTGIPRELARTMLPLGTYTHFFTTVNLHNLLKFLAERNHTHAQYEIQVYAAAIEELITQYIPVTMRAYKDINCK